MPLTCPNQFRCRGRGTSGAVIRVRWLKTGAAPGFSEVVSRHIVVGLERMGGKTEV